MIIVSCSVGQTVALIDRMNRNYFVYKTLLRHAVHVIKIPDYIHIRQCIRTGVLCHVNLYHLNHSSNILRFFPIK